MEIDLRKSLELAFAHLDRFSVPGVGLFQKTYKKSEIDHRDKLVLPPEEVFSLQNEGARLDASKEIEILVNFFFQQFKTTLERARDAARDLGTLIVEEIDAYDSYVILGVGEIRRNEIGELRFIAQKDREALTSDRFFGLAPVGYTIGGLAGGEAETAGKMNLDGSASVPIDVKAEKVGGEEQPLRLTKKPETKESEPDSGEPEVEKSDKEEVKIADQPPVEKKQEPTVIQMDLKSRQMKDKAEAQERLDKMTPKEPKKKRKAWKIIVTLLLIWGLIFAVIWYRGEIYNFAQGLFNKQPVTLSDGTDSNGSDTDGSDADGTDTDGSDTDGSDGSDLNGSDTNGSDNDGSDTGSDPAIEDDSDTGENTDSDFTDFGEAGEAPVPGQHYLIVSSSKNGSYAEQEARKYAKSPYKGKAVAPRAPGGFYKISIYNSSDKMEVIQKMVEWKDTFEEGTWIYSPQ